MIIRQFGRVPGRRLLALSHPVVGGRFFSTEPPARTTTATAEEVPVATPTAKPGTVEYAVEMQRLRRVERGDKSDLDPAADRKQFRNTLKPTEIGTKVSGGYEPEQLLRNPPQPSAVSLELLMASQCHLGHATQLWNPRNSDYIMGVRMGIHIISLEVTAAYLRRAAKVVEAVARRGGLILFVGTRRHPTARRTVVNAARLAGGYHVFERWVPGTLTNGQQVLRGAALEAVDAADRPVENVREHLENWPPLKPDLVICLNPLENVSLLHECALLTIPTIGIIDTDADASRVTYPIPANDDSLRSVGVIAGVLGRAGQAGQKQRLQAAEQGTLTYDPVTMEEIRRYDDM